jgi:hypothetical protein
MTSKHQSWVRVGDLKFDETYQRTDKIVVTRVNDIANNFDEGALGVILVSERGNGDLYVIDGMHRTLGVMKRFGEEYRIPALLYQGMSVQDEAHAFMMQTRRTSVSAISEHKAKVIAGDRMACDIQAILDKHGLNTTSGDSHSPHRFYAIRTVEAIWKESGADVVEMIIDMAIDAMRPHMAQASGPIINGIYEVLLRYENRITPEQIVNGVRNRGPQYINSRAAGLMKMNVKRHLAETQAVVDAINHGKRHKLPPVVETRRAKRLVISE